MAPDLPLALSFALAELGLGVRELPGAPTHERIAKYLTSVGQPADDEIPWCSAFVNWCVTQTGVNGTNKPNARSWLDWGLQLITPQLGCIAVFRRGSKAWQGHVGFVLDTSSSWVTLLGGNQEDRVKVSQYGVGDLLSYRRCP